MRPSGWGASPPSTDGVGVGKLSNHSILPSLLLNLIHKNGYDNYDPDSHKLPKWLDIYKYESVLNHRNDQCADDSPNHGAGTTKEAGAADHDGRDAVPQNRFAGRSCTGGKIPGKKNYRAY